MEKEDRTESSGKQEAILCDPVPRPEKLYLITCKVANFLTKDNSITEEFPVAVYTMPNKGIDVLVDILIDEELEQSNRNITLYDMAVMDAVYTLYKYNVEVFTPEMVVRVMAANMDADVTKQKKVAVIESIYKLKGMTEEEYIKIMLPKMINKKKGDFQSFDQKNRMSEIVNPFGIRANPDLFKKHYSTGFPELDEVLSGGFTPGVHVIGAVSSLGKSTFLLQMADNMASQKIPVIYVSLEMSSRDLAAKLISKHSLLLTFEHPEKAKSMGDLTLEPVLTHLRDDEWEIMKEAVAITKEHGKYLTVFERKAEGITINSIEQYVKNYIETYKIKPVVIIDYLQILSPTEDMKRCTDKQCVDRNISEIRSLSMTYDVAVIAISSFNREYYNQPASLQAFKESGNIEYSSDTLIGLQLFGVGRKSMDIEEEKKKYPRTIEAIIFEESYRPFRQSHRI